MPRKFFAEKNGGVAEFILVVAAVVIVLAYAMPIVKQSMKCATVKSKTGISSFFGNSQTKAECGKDKEVIDEVEEKDNKGNIAPPTGVGEDVKGGEKEKEEVVYEGEEALSEEEKEAKAVTYTADNSVELSCQNTHSYSEFTIPDTPVGGMGTQNITVSNAKNYPIYVNVSSALGANGLRITSDHSYYRKVERGTKENFAIGWQWNPSETGTERGNGKIYFQVECAEPSDKAKQYTYPTEPPSNFSLAKAEDTSLSLKWNDVRTSSEYLLYRGNTLVYRGKDLAYTDKDLLAGTTYTYKLYTMESFQRKEYAELKATTTGESPLPLAPSYVKVVATTPDTIYVLFGRSQKATSYRVYLDGKEVSETPWNSYINRKMEPNKTYKVSVVAENSYGVSEAVHVDATTTGSSGVPDPTNFVLVDRSSSHVTVKWDPVPGATRYKVISFNGIAYDGPNTTFTERNMVPGASRFYFLYAYVGGRMSNGIEGDFYSLGLREPLNPYHMKASVVTNTSIQLNWTKGEFAETTLVTMDGKQVYGGEGSQYVATGLKPNTRYIFTFRSVNASGSSTTSSFEVFTTNDDYQGSQELYMVCANPQTTKTFAFPQDIKGNEDGVYALHIANKSNSDMTLSLNSLTSSGSLFDESLIQLNYDATPFVVPKGQISIYPIKWQAVSPNEKDYKGKDGQLTVSLKGGC